MCLTVITHSVLISFTMPFDTAAVEANFYFFELAVKHYLNRFETTAVAAAEKNIVKMNCRVS